MLCVIKPVELRCRSAWSFYNNFISILCTADTVIISDSSCVTNTEWISCLKTAHNRCQIDIFILDRNNIHIIMGNIRRVDITSLLSGGWGTWSSRLESTASLGPNAWREKRRFYDIYCDCGTFWMRNWNLPKLIRVKTVQGKPTGVLKVSSYKLRKIVAQCMFKCVRVSFLRCLWEFNIQILCIDNIRAFITAFKILPIYSICLHL